MRQWSTCPRCRQPAVRLIRKLILGPARSITCPACGAELHMPVSSLLVGSAPLILAALPAFSLNLAGRFAAACLVLLEGLVAAKLLHLIAPLTAEPRTSLVRKAATAVVALVVCASLAPVGIIAVARATSLMPAATMPHRVRSAHFELYSDLAPDRLRRYARTFDATYRFFDRSIHPIHPAAEPFRVHIFERGVDYRRFARAVGYREPPLGFCSYPDRLAAFSLSARGPPSGLALALHELGHYLVQAAAGRRIPEWVNEGFATFLEKVVGHLGDARTPAALSVGYFDRVRFAATRRLPRLALPALLVRRQSQHWSFGWASAARALVLYLHHAGRLRRLLAGVRRGCARADCRGVLLEVTGAPSVAELERRWRAWIEARARDPQTPFWDDPLLLTAPQWRRWRRDRGRDLRWDAGARLYRRRALATAPFP